jgi:hypothetical protein
MGSKGFAELARFGRRNAGLLLVTNELVGHNSIRRNRHLVRPKARTYAE